MSGATGHRSVSLASSFWKWWQTSAFLHSQISTSSMRESKMYNCLNWKWEHAAGIEPPCSVLSSWPRIVQCTPRLRNAPALGVFLHSIAVEEIGKLPERVPFSRPAIPHSGDSQRHQKLVEPAERRAAKGCKECDPSALRRQSANGRYASVTELPGSFS